MTKNKSRASAKSRSSTKSRSKVRKAKPVVQSKMRRSKQEAALTLLNRPSGTTITAIVEATGWQAHTVPRLSGCGGSEETRPGIIDFIRRRKRRPPHRSRRPKGRRFFYQSR
jgi:hypothetical protein